MSTDCVILAAGLSSRMGQNKMTMEFGGSTVLESCMEAFYASCAGIIVVTGKYHDEISHLLKPYSKVRVVYNDNYAEGMFSSVKAGLRHVEEERFFLTPGDYPLIKRQTVEKLMRCPSPFAVPTFRGQTGHPILLDKLFVPGILASEHASLRDFLGDMEGLRQEVVVDDAGVLADVDTIEDYMDISKKEYK